MRNLLSSLPHAIRHPLTSYDSGWVNEPHASQRLRKCFTLLPRKSINNRWLWGAHWRLVRHSGWGFVDDWLYKTKPDFPPHTPLYPAQKTALGLADAQNVPT